MYCLRNHSHTSYIHTFLISTINLYDDIQYTVIKKRWRESTSSQGGLADMGNHLSGFPATNASVCAAFYRETNPVTANTIKDWQAAAQLQVVKVFFPLHVKTAYVLFFSKMLILVTSHHIQQPFSARCRMWISGFWSTVHSTGKFSFADCAIAILRSQMWQADRPCRHTKWSENCSTARVIP